MMRRVFVGDDTGNIFSLPVSPVYNGLLAQGVRPPGFELVALSAHINPRYVHLASASLALYQMGEAAKILLEAHGDHLQSIGAPNLTAVGIAFEQMAANINLAQRQAREGFGVMSDIRKK